MAIKGEEAAITALKMVALKNSFKNEPGKDTIQAVPVVDNGCGGMQ